jgi:hypothetical protein
MRRFLLIACVVALAAGAAASMSAAAPPGPGVEVTVCATGLGTPVSDSIDGAGAEHVLGLPVYNHMHLGSDCSATDDGELDYVESYTAWPDGRTTAWCSFEMQSSTYGNFSGHCNGTLFTGHLVGHRSDGSTLEGTYQTDNPQGGIYHLTITFNVR